MKTSSTRLKQNAKTESAEKASKQRIAVIVVASAFLILGFGILIEQYIHWGVFFEMDDFLHHEVFAFVFIVIGITVILAWYFIVKYKH